MLWVPVANNLDEVQGVPIDYRRYRTTNVLDVTQRTRLPPSSRHPVDKPLPEISPGIDAGSTKPQESLGAVSLCRPTGISSIGSGL
jgi:hypothetical protein